jgi:uncharacterized protein YcfJ
MISKLQANLSRASRLAIVGVSASALVLSACASTSGVAVENMTPAQIELHQRAEAMQRTVWQGAATGAILGGLIAAASGGDSRNILRGAIAGGALGYGAGSYLGRQQQRYQTAEQQIEAVTADIHQKNADAEALIQVTQLVITEHRETLARLDSGYQTGLVSEAQRQQEYDQLADTERVLAEAIESSEEQLNVFQEVRTHFADAGKDDLTAMDAELTYLSNQTEQLAALGSELGATRGA